MMMSIIEDGSGNNPVEDTAVERQLPPAKRKRLQRHTAHQIQELEAYVLPFFLFYKKIFNKLLSIDN